ncbi:MAG: Holliday junction resolvase RuvX [Microgenomates group bacterium]
MNILGIDFGLKKIGLAIGSGEVIYPYKVVSEKELFSEILKICQEEEIKEIVIGIPSEKLKKDVLEFARKIAKKTKLPIFYVDETLTSKEAIAKMIAAGIRRKKRRKKEDAFAAALILEKFLEERRQGV